MIYTVSGGQWLSAMGFAMLSYQKQITKHCGAAYKVDASMNYSVCWNYTKHLNNNYFTWHTTSSMHQVYGQCTFNYNYVYHMQGSLSYASLISYAC